MEAQCLSERKSDKRFPALIHDPLGNGVRTANSLVTISHWESRGAACLNIDRVVELLGVRKGGRWWGGALRGHLGDGGSLGTPTHIPQNDSDDALIILNIHKWGTKFFSKKFSSPISSGLAAAKV